MKALIVDDHKINYVLIKNLLKESFPEIDVIDMADSVGSALERIESVSYDLIFLDMQLQDGVGFDVLKEMTDFVFVIVISSHKDYALEAFKYNVVDYLMKPLDAAEFKIAMNKFLNLYHAEEQKKSADLQPAADHKNNDRIFVITKNEYVVIDKKNIMFIKAQGKYSEIHTVKNERYVSSRNLKEFEDAMTPLMIRVHHSYLVNVNYIVSYSRETLELRLESGSCIPVSVRKREELFKNIRAF